ncbi:MAG TPA: nitroreductase family protein [Nitrospirota bacterium]|nr:nitroreductase family protein [Nitrospirota bacterium]
MSLFSIDETKCKRDGICADECPRRLIEMKVGSSIPTPVEDAEDRCIKCGHCVAVCPNGAFTHSDLKTADFSLVRKEMALTTEQAEYFLRSRRSIRTYQARTIEPDKIEKLIEIARYAPTGTNSQQVKWLVVNSREKVKNMAAMTVDLMRHMIKNKNPLSDRYRLATVVKAWDSGIDSVSRNAPALVIAYAPKDYGLAQVDCTSALCYLDLTAPTLGFGCCWAGFLMIGALHWPPFQQSLALPEGHASFGIMMIGYPKYHYYLLPPRNKANIGWQK